MFISWSFGVHLVFSFCSETSVVLFNNLGVSGCHNTLFLSSLYLIIGLTLVLFVPYVDSLMG